MRYIQDANFGQQTANFRQIVTYLFFGRVGYELVTQPCLLEAF